MSIIVYKSCAHYFFFNGLNELFLHRTFNFFRYPVLSISDPGSSKTIIDHLLVLARLTLSSSESKCSIIFPSDSVYKCWPHIPLMGRFWSALFPRRAIKQAQKKPLSAQTHSYIPYHYILQIHLYKVFYNQNQHGLAWGVKLGPRPHTAWQAASLAVLASTGTRWLNLTSVISSN